MALSCLLLGLFTPNLGILWISVCSFRLCGSIVANPIIYKLKASPSWYEIRQLCAHGVRKWTEWMVSGHGCKRYMYKQDGVQTIRFGLCCLLLWPACLLVKNILIGLGVLWEMWKWRMRATNCSRKTSTVAKSKMPENTITLMSIKRQQRQP